MDDGVEDVRLAFDRFPAIYDRVRPSYPDELFDQLFVALPREPRIVEVGPGTGQATAVLLRRGAWVTAVEYGANLAGYLANKLGHHEGLTVFNRSFEDVKLATNSFDAVVSATAYHWIPAPAQIARPLELLKPHGLLGVIDLIQVDEASDDGYFERVQPIYESFGQQANNWAPKHYANAMPAIVASLEASRSFHTPEIYRVPWDQTYTSTQYRELLWTYSGTQKMPEPQRTAMVEQLVAVIDEEHAGTITRPLVATLTLATRL